MSVEKLGGPAEAARPEQGGGKATLAVLREHAVDQRLVGGRRGAANGERDRAQSELEEPVAAAGLQVVVPLGRGPGDELDLPVVEAEALIDRARLGLDRAVVGQEDALRAALDDGRCDRAAGDVGQAIGWRRRRQRSSCAAP